MTELKANPKTGVIDNPQYPCYKAEGLCKVRFNPPDPERKFECVNDPSRCRYFKRAGKAGAVLAGEMTTGKESQCQGLPTPPPVLE